jgi:hypothetical protein
VHNKKLNISPAWIFSTANGELFEPVLFRLLEGIRDTGKLTAAATNAGISYRHAWTSSSFQITQRWPAYSETDCAHSHKPILK